MEPKGCERHRWASREPEWSFGESDIEGKTAREAASELGKERVSNEWERVSQNFGVVLTRRRNSKLSTLSRPIDIHANTRFIQTNTPFGNAGG
jgi:hypothetical protein